MQPCHFLHRLHNVVHGQVPQDALVVGALKARGYLQHLVVRQIEEPLNEVAVDKVGGR